MYVLPTDEVYMRGSRGGYSPPSLKIHKDIGAHSNTGLDPLKSQSYQASIQCWVIIGTPAKRKWRFAGGSMMTRL